MSHRRKIPSTPGLRFLSQKGIEFKIHTYKYEEHGGTTVAARETGFPEHRIIKTLVFETDHRQFLIILQHGDFQVSSRELARQAGAKRVFPTRPEKALQQTGYQVGGTSPFGTRHSLPVYVEKTILDLPSFLINAGGRGLLVEITPGDLQKALEIIPVTVSRKA